MFINTSDFFNASRFQNCMTSSNRNFLSTVEINSNQFIKSNFAIISYRTFFPD